MMVDDRQEGEQYYEDEELCDACLCELGRNARPLLENRGERQGVSESTNVVSDGRQYVQRFRWTRERVAVVYYCRHSFRVLLSVLNGYEDKDELVQEFRRKVKRFWMLFVNGRMSKYVLLIKIERFVRGSCEEARRVNLLSEFFRLWREQSGENLCEESKLESETTSEDTDIENF